MSFRQRPTGKTGATPRELLLAMAILLVVVFSLLGLFYGGSSFNSGSQEVASKPPSITLNSGGSIDYASAAAKRVAAAQTASVPVHFTEDSATPPLAANSASTIAPDSHVAPAPDATVKIGGVNRELTANSIGSYPRYTVPAKSTVPITLKLNPYEVVNLQAVDGGALNQKYSSITGTADNQGQLEVNFNVMANPGSYRVLVMRAGTRSLFDFWVGPNLPQRVSSSSH